MLRLMRSGDSNEGLRVAEDFGSVSALRCAACKLASEAAPVLEKLRIQTQDHLSTNETPATVVLPVTGLCESAAVHGVRASSVEADKRVFAVSRSGLRCGVSRAPTPPSRQRFHSVLL